MRLRRLWRSGVAHMVAAVLAYVSLALLALAVVVAAALTPAQRRALADAVADQAATFVLGALAAAAGLSWLLVRGPGAYPRRARRMADDVRVVLGVNPAHRLPAGGPPELADLAGAVNALADARSASRPDDRADADDVELERNRLAAVLADLSVPVLVCSPGGRVQLYNAAARGLLGDHPALMLGRPVFALVDRDAVQAALAGGSPGAAVPTALPDGRAVVARVAPVRGGTGFVVVLETATAPGPARLEVGSRPEYYAFDLLDLPEGATDLSDRPLSELAFTVLDTETTGFSPEDDEVVAVGAVRVVGGRVRRHEVLQRLVDPGRPVPPTATAVHGLGDDVLRGQPRLDAVLRDLAAFAEGSVLVGHNVAFDLGFFRAHEERTGVRLDAPALDTLLLDAALHPEHESHGLDDVAQRLGVEVTGRHTALGDALVTAEVLARQLPLLEAAGVRTLGQAVAASRESYLARAAERG